MISNMSQEPNNDNGRFLDSKSSISLEGELIERFPFEDGNLDNLLQEFYSYRMDENKVISKELKGMYDMCNLLNTKLSGIIRHNADNKHVNCTGLKENHMDLHNELETIRLDILRIRYDIMERLALLVPKDKLPPTISKEELHYDIFSKEIPNLERIKDKIKTLEDAQKQNQSEIQKSQEQCRDIAEEILSYELYDINLSEDKHLKKIKAFHKNRTLARAREDYEEFRKKEKEEKMIELRSRLEKDKLDKQKALDKKVFVLLCFLITAVSYYNIL